VIARHSFLFNTLYSILFRYTNYYINSLLSMVRNCFIRIKSSFININYSRLIPESRRWYVNSHRVSRVNKLLQLCSTKQSSSIGLNKVGSPAPTTIVYDKPALEKDSLRTQTSSISCLLIDQQLRTITCCLFILWFDELLCLF
jgi:hypothetical protein